jgi:hypothetical protein
MSVLDMFASAVGAFIMCVVILFPYYKKDVSSELAKAKAALEEGAKKVATTRAQTERMTEEVRSREPQVQAARRQVEQLNRCHKETEICRAELAKNFLMVQIEWSGGVDVNLYVKDPDGHEFSWSRTNRSGRDFPGSKAALSIDVAVGPGIEVWVDPSAKAGAYQISYAVPRSPGTVVTVNGAVFDRYGRKTLPVRSLRDNALRIHAATIQITNDGTVTVQ